MSTDNFFNFMVTFLILSENNVEMWYLFASVSREIDNIKTFVSCSFLLLSVTLVSFQIVAFTSTVYCDVCRFS